MRANAPTIHKIDIEFHPSVDSSINSAQCIDYTLAADRKATCFLAYLHHSNTQPTRHNLHVTLYALPSSKIRAPGFNPTATFSPTAGSIAPASNSNKSRAAFCTVSEIS